MCGVPDDELHFVLECPQFDYVRDKYIPLYYRSSPSAQRLCELLSGDDRPGLNGLAQYLRRVNPIKRETYKCLKTVAAEDVVRLDQTFLRDM